MVKQKYLDKAEVLIEALPYIQRFTGKLCGEIWRKCHVGR